MMAMKRIYIEISDEAGKNIDGLMRELNLKSRSTLLWQALSAFSSLVRYRAQGYEICLTKGDEKVKVILPSIDIF